MDRTETQASLRVLWALVRADGVVTPAELRLLELAAAHENGGAAPSDPGAIDLDRELAQLQSEEARRLTLKAALAIATVEGAVTAEAHRVLERIHRALARSEDDRVPALTLAADEGAAADRMREVQRAIAKATDEFVHRLARAGAAGGGVDPNEYENWSANWTQRSGRFSTKRWRPTARFRLRNSFRGVRVTVHSRRTARTRENPLFCPVKNVASPLLTRRTCISAHFLSSRRSASLRS